jgi:hypothetical protein
MRSKNAGGTRTRCSFTAIAVVAAIACGGFAMTSSSAQAAAIPTACKKITTEVINADKVYVALQYGVVQAAKAYNANQNLTTRLNYNDSYIAVFKAAITEYTYFLKNPQCYPTTPFSKVKQGIADNQKSISAVQADNVAGQLVGDPTKMASYKPVGLLK